MCNNNYCGGCCQSNCDCCQSYGCGNNNSNNNCGGGFGNNGILIILVIIILFGFGGWC